MTNERVKLRPSVRAALEHSIPLTDGDVEINGWVCEGQELAGSRYKWWAIALDHRGMLAAKYGFTNRGECIAFAQATKHPFPPKKLEG
jgi:hypothetical protein